MRIQIMLVTLAATLATGCGDAVAPPPPPPPPPVIPLYYLKAPIHSGDNQTDTVLARLALPFRLLVRRGDTPAPGIAVLWVMYDESVGVLKDTTWTDNTGIATSPVNLKLGPWPGWYAARASVLGVVQPAPISIGTDAPCGSAVCFIATAHAATPTQFLDVAGDRQKGSINTPLAADYVVRVTDSYGNAAAGVVIDWASVDGGSITPVQIMTAYTGEARARATLGPGVGSQGFTATAGALPGAPQVTFTATAFTPADINGIWDWTELYNNPVCADTGSYVFAQNGSGFSGLSLQVGVCYFSTGPSDNSRTVPDTVSNGLVLGDSITFFVAPRCVYSATVFGTPPDSVSGTTQCSNSTGTRINTGTWKGVRERPIASVTVTPDSQTVGAGATLQLTAQLGDANGNRLFFRAVTWSSDNPAVASVSPAGVVTAVSTGSATITASAGGQSGAVTVLVP
jgi:hypothetical protein